MELEASDAKQLRTGSRTRHDDAQKPVAYRALAANREQPIGNSQLGIANREWGSPIHTNMLLVLIKIGYYTLLVSNRSP